MFLSYTLNSFFEICYQYYKFCATLMWRTQ